MTVKGIRSPLKIGLAKIFSLVLTLTTLLGFVTTVIPEDSQLGKVFTVDSANAFLFCSYELGQGMDASDRSPAGSYLAPYPNASSRNRIWTLQELYSAGTGYVGYQGENSRDQASFISRKGNNPDLLRIKVPLSRLSSARGIGPCFVGGTTNLFFNGGYSIASLITSFSSLASTSAFDQKMICSGEDSDSPYCIDLVGIIGGKAGRDGGIIGALTSGVYLPLSVLVVAISVIFILFRELVKRDIRKSFMDLSWILGSFITGVALLSMPSTLASAPMVASNLVGSCVVGAVSGNNCLGGEGNHSNNSGVLQNTSDKACFSGADGLSISEQMSMNVNGLVCTTWKSFVLNPMTQGQFGLPFNELDVTNPHISEMIDKAGYSKEEFCVGMKSSQSASETVLSGNAVYVSDSVRVCNLMAYQMALKTDVIQAGEKPLSSDVKYNPNWYKLINVIGQDEKMFNTWVSFPQNMYHRGSLASVAIFASIAGGAVIITTSVFALVYYMTTLLLVVFAPLFFLFGINPNKGREVFKGWLGKLVESFFFYIVSAMFLSVSVVFYGAVLGAITGVATGVLMVTVVSIALLTYRREFLSMIGGVRMSGERLSNSLVDSVFSKARGAKDLGLTAVAGAVGSKLAGGEAVDGAKESLRRQLARQTGFVGDTFKQIGRADSANRNSIRALSRNFGDDVNAGISAKNSAIEANEADERNLLNYESQADNLLSRKEESSKDFSRLLELSEEADVALKEFATKKDKLGRRLVNEEDFRKFSSIQEKSLSSMELKKQLDDLRLNPEANKNLIKKTESEIKQINKEIQETKDSMSKDQFEKLSKAKDKILSVKFGEKVEMGTKISEILDKNKEINEELSKVRDQYDKAYEAYLNSSNEIISSEAKIKASSASQDYVKGEMERLLQGEVVSKEDYSRIRELADEEFKKVYVREMSERADGKVVREKKVF